MRQTMPYLICSICFILTSCAGVERPDMRIGTIEVLGLVAKFRSYNVKTDFDDEGNRLANSVAVDKTLSSLKDVRGFTCVAPVDLKKLKAWIAQSRDALNQCKAGQ